MKRSFAGGSIALCLVFLYALTSAPFSASAQTLASIRGLVVRSDGRPVADARIIARGDNMMLKRTTDAGGRFVFDALPSGSYGLSAGAAAGVASARVDLAGETVSLTLTLLPEIGAVKSSGSSLPHASGTDVVLNQAMLSHSPAAGSLPDTLLQLPGAARGANGVIHINGDHGDINYIVDGVPIPQELNREIGSEIDPNDISFVRVLEGAYPARYGGRFASVIDINTNVGTGRAGMDGYAHAGSFATYDANLGYHTPLGRGSLVADVRVMQGNRFLDPPNFTAAHDSGATANAFLRYTIPYGNDFMNVTLLHAHQTFQIPNDLAGGEPAATDDNEGQDDTFLALQVHHALRSNGALTYGIGLKRSRITDYPDPTNDFIYGQSLNLAAGGTSSDCANGVVPACAYSLYADRTARDIILNADNDVRSAKHDVRFGGSYDATSVQKLYAVTLQPMNFLAPLLTPLTPNAATTVIDNAPNTGHYGTLYAQDGWSMAGRWMLDYGVRYDTFQIFSNEFSRRFSQVSPRVKLARLYGQDASAYLYLGRFFTPFSLENVSPGAAQLLNLPNQPAVAQFDLRPQRDTDVEIGGHLRLGAGELGLRVAQKIAVDLIDDTQVGVTALHQDINYARGNISTQSAYYQRPLAHSGRAYVSLTHTRSVNKGCETQLLAPCFGAPSDWTPADHDQNWDASGGVTMNDRRGGWLAIDGEYGSGLSSAYCMPASTTCKVPPHTTFDLLKGVGLGKGSALTLRVRNIFNDRYLITYLNAQGNHVAIGRTLEIGWQFSSLLTRVPARL